MSVPTPRKVPTWASVWKTVQIYGFLRDSAKEKLNSFHSFPTPFISLPGLLLFQIRLYASNADAVHSEHIRGIDCLWNSKASVGNGCNLICKEADTGVFYYLILVLKRFCHSLFVKIR